VQASKISLGRNGFPQSVGCGITSQDIEKGEALTRIIHDGLSRNGRVARDKREERDLRDVWALFLPVALFPPVSPVSLESGIGDCRRIAHE
jgi:hypothetical protein